MYTLAHTNGMNVYTVRQFRMSLKEALDNAPCKVQRGTQVFTVTIDTGGKEAPRVSKPNKASIKQDLARKVDAMQVCKKGHLYKGAKCTQKGCNG